MWRRYEISAAVPQVNRMSALTKDDFSADSGWSWFLPWSPVVPLLSHFIFSKELLYFVMSLTLPLFW
jgi:hypothetical protein